MNFLSAYGDTDDGRENIINQNHKNNQNSHWAALMYKTLTETQILYQAVSESIKIQLSTVIEFADFFSGLCTISIHWNILKIS